jgi:hypothetical protein
MFTNVYDENKKHSYKELEDYEEPSREELLRFIESVYASFSELLMHPRTMPCCNVALDFMRKWKDDIDKSNITSECIRWHQKQEFQKIPEEELKKRQAFIKGLYSKTGTIENGIIKITETF